MDDEKAISGGTADGCVEFTAGILPTAARELAAFAHAISELFGAEQARQAVEDWVEELKSSDWPNGRVTPDCRQVTIAAAARLAKRVHCRSFAWNSMKNDAILGDDRLLLPRPWNRTDFHVLEGLIKTQ